MTYKILYKDKDVSEKVSFITYGGKKQTAKGIFLRTKIICWDKDRDKKIGNCTAPNNKLKVTDKDYKILKETNDDYIYGS